MNVLVVDDEIDQAQSLRRGLRSKDHAVFHALNGQQALDRLADDGPNIELVITDYAMPGMHGIELLENIRNRYGDLPVIMMTAYGRKDLVIEALRLRCNGFIEKPFSLITLVNEIDRVTEHTADQKEKADISRRVPMLVHQINNPLTAISAGAELAMLYISDPASVRRCIHSISSGARQIQAINRELLGSARQRRAQVELVDLSALVAACLDTFRELLLLKGVEVEIRTGASPMWIRGNRFELEQLVKNLLANAIEAMEGGDGKLFVGVAPVTGPDSLVSLTVEDTGCGIPQERMASVFTPYTTSKSSGTGLGLALVREVAEKHGGRIEVQSVEGCGTKFTVTFPAIVENHARI